MDSLLLITPVFLIFEFWQLVISERYLGLKQIARNGDPRNLGLSEVTAFFWSSALVLYGLWTLALVFLPLARLHASGLFLVTALGYSLRRNTSLKWVLVILTFEGAVRIGLLISLLAMIWRRL